MTMTFNSAYPQIFIGTIHVDGRDHSYAFDAAGKLDTSLVTTENSSI